MHQFDINAKSFKSFEGNEITLKVLDTLQSFASWASKAISDGNKLALKVLDTLQSFASWASKLSLIECDYPKGARALAFCLMPKLYLLLGKIILEMKVPRSAQ